MMTKLIPKDSKLLKMISPEDKGKALGLITKSDLLIIYFYLFIRVIDYKLFFIIVNID